MRFAFRCLRGHTFSELEGDELSLLPNQNRSRLVFYNFEQHTHAPTATAFLKRRPDESWETQNLHGDGAKLGEHFTHLHHCRQCGRVPHPPNTYGCTVVPFEHSTRR
jgi:hypothetical protein